MNENSVCLSGKIGRTRDALRRDLEKHAEEIDDGAVLRWAAESRDHHGIMVTYRYTAIYVKAKRRWYTSAALDGLGFAPYMTHEALMRALNQDHVESVWLATVWERLSGGESSS